MRISRAFDWSHSGLPLHNKMHDCTSATCGEICFALFRSIERFTSATLMSEPPPIGREIAQRSYLIKGKPSQPYESNSEFETLPLIRRANGLLMYVCMFTVQRNKLRSDDICHDGSRGIWLVPGLEREPCSRTRPRYHDTPLRHTAAASSMQEPYPIACQCVSCSSW